LGFKAKPARETAQKIQGWGRVELVDGIKADFSILDKF